MMLRLMTAMVFVACAFGATAAPAGSAPAAPGLLVCHFDTPALKAAVNDFGAVQPEVNGFSYTAAAGCPVAPEAGALNAGVAAPAGSYTLPLARSASLGQGTLEFWVKLDWDFGERAMHNLFTIPLIGGYWNCIGICYHGLMGPTSEIFESNIMDGLDHAPEVEAGPDGLNWRRGEWHHVALCWTEHSQRFFGDGKLLGAMNYGEPLSITPAVGRLYVGCSSRTSGEALRGWVSDLRLCTLPLYAGLDRIPVPDHRLPDTLPPGLALATEGVTATADSTAPDLISAADVPALHDGQYGPETHFGILPETGDATVMLAQEQSVSAFVWSRDGRPFAGPGGQGWARADSLPRDFVIEVSRDGQTWMEVARRTGFKIIPRELAKLTAARFAVPFPTTTARQVRLRLTGDTTAKLGQWPALDEVQVLAADGTPAKIAQVTTERSRFRRSFAAANVLDGRVGEESCWKSATPGHGEVTLTLPQPRKLSGVSWSRSREGLQHDGTPADVAIEVSADGTTWGQAATKTGLADAKTCAVAFAPRLVKAVRLKITKTTDGAPPVLDEVSFLVGGDAQ